MGSYEIEILSGEEAGRILPLADKLTIGRVKANDLALRDAAASRQHARLFERGGQHHLVDLNSSHGTFVNGRKITRQSLQDGDEIRIGETKLRFQRVGAAAAAPAPAAPESVPGREEDEEAADDGGFELEMPDDLLPAAPAPRVEPSPSPSPDPSPAEDPFADDDEEEAPSRAVASAESFGRTSTRKGGGKGKLYRAEGDAPSSGGVLSDDLDQHGAGFRWAAIVAAIALALGAGWGAMKLVGAAKGDPETEPYDQELEDGSDQPGRPARPSRPSR